MKTKKFFDLNHAKRYLTHNLIRVAGQPIYVMDLSEKAGNIIMHYTLANNPQGKMKNIPVLNDDVDMNPVKLGMTRLFNGVTWMTFYISRYPSRTWSIGLSRENMALQDPRGEGIDHNYTDEILPSPTLAETILGKFLPLDEAKEQLRKAKGCLPLSRRFCFDHTGDLFFKMLGVPVGRVETAGVTLKDEFAYLKEVMQEDIKC